MKNHFLHIFFGTTLLCIVAFYNKYPLLTERSGDYIVAGFSREYSWWSSYGTFLAHSSWGFSIWLVVLTQSWMLTSLILYFFKYLGGNHQSFYFLLCILILGFCTSGSVVTSTISPGVFRSISFLAVGLLFFTKKIPSSRRFMIFGFAILSAIMSLTNFIFLIVSSFLYLVLRMLRAKGLGLSKLGRNMKLLVFTSVFFLGIALTVNYLCFFHSGEGNTDELTFSPKGCHDGFLLHWTNSANYWFSVDRYDQTMPGFNVREKSELLAADEAVISDKVEETQLVYFKSLVVNVFLDMFNVKINPYNTPYENSTTFKALSSQFNWETREYMISRQFQNWLNLSHLSYLQIILAILISFYLFQVFCRSARDNKSKRFIGFFLALYIINCVIGSVTLSGEEKIENQLVWIMILPVLADLSRFTQTVSFRFFSARWKKYFLCGKKIIRDEHERSF